MTIRVESTWGGAYKYKFTLILPDGSREYIPCEEGDNWNRSYASMALDLLEVVYRLKRQNIRFKVR